MAIHMRRESPGVHTGAMLRLHAKFRKRWLLRETAPASRNLHKNCIRRAQVRFCFFLVFFISFLGASGVRGTLRIAKASWRLLRITKDY